MCKDTKKPLKDATNIKNSLLDGFNLKSVKTVNHFVCANYELSNNLLVN